MDDDLDSAKAVWLAGDYGPTSEQLEPAAVTLIDAIPVRPRQRVLDIAAGHGNAALAAASRGATVTATDFAANMIARGSQRSRQAGMEIAWREADACALPFTDARFDVAVSVFGMIFAASHRDAAAEAVRVTAPGGQIGLTSWTPDGVTAALITAGNESSEQDDASGEVTPFPAPAEPTILNWGDPDYVASLFEPLGCQVATERRSLTFRYPSWEAWRAAFEAHGMSVVARQHQSPDEYEAMFDTMRTITERYVEPGPEIVYEADYLQAIVTVQPS